MHLLDPLTYTGLCSSLSTPRRLVGPAETVPKDSEIGLINIIVIIQISVLATGDRGDTGSTVTTLQIAEILQVDVAVLVKIRLKSYQYLPGFIITTG